MTIPSESTVCLPLRKLAPQGNLFVKRLHLVFTSFLATPLVASARSITCNIEISRSNDSQDHRLNSIALPRKSSWIRQKSLFGSATSHRIRQHHKTSLYVLSPVSGHPP